MQPAVRPQLPDVVSRAFIAAAKVSKELTSLAAVAGAAADHVADAALRYGSGQGDCQQWRGYCHSPCRGKTAVVGLKAIGAEKMAGRLYVRGGSGIGGVASSGWMGRSFSPGVADLVTVWAGSASIADAAATLIAGEITACGINIEQARAADLDPASDLGDMKVTTAVHDLSPSQRKDALDRGSAVAAGMYSNGLIHGCFLSVQGDFNLLDHEGIVQIES